MRYASLYLVYFVYFIATGFSTFVPKYYGEIGLTDGQIGLLGSVPTLVALALMPMLGALTDRVSKRRHMLAVMLALMAGACFLVPYSAGMLTLLLAVSGYMVFNNATLPLINTIAIEYAAQIHRPYGPIRLLGTVGYQVGALLVGYILSASLRSLYPLMGAALLVSCAVTFMMPNVGGRQHRQAKVPLKRLFADRHILALYLLIFFASVTTQFYSSFYSKHLGDLGMSNASVSWITLMSTICELPFLYFGDRIARRTNIWNWLIVGMLANAVRWLGIAYASNVFVIMLFQLPCVTVLACFEFFPALYLSRRAPAELTGSAQTMLSLTIFGAARIVGSLLGGQICERIGIPNMLCFNGVWLLVGCAVLWPVTRRLIRDETVLDLGA